MSLPKQQLTQELQTYSSRIFLSKKSISPINRQSALTFHRAEANKVLHLQSDNDQSKLQYLLEYYSLVREGKTDYISKSAFHDITGSHPQEPPEFFKTYKEEFQPQYANKKRKSRA